MPFRKSLLFTLLFFFISPLILAAANLGTYTYNLDTVYSMMKLSLIEEGVDPKTEEFQENVESVEVMVSAFGADNLISNMKNQSPFSCIEITDNSLILKLNSGDFEIPIEIIENEIYSKDPEYFDKILGYFVDNKLYFNFILTFSGDKQTSISKENKSYYMIPFGKEV